MVLFSMHCFLLFFFPFPMCSLLTYWKATFWNLILNGSGERGHPCFLEILGGKFLFSNHCLWRVQEEPLVLISWCCCCCYEGRSDNFQADCQHGSQKFQGTIISAFGLLRLFSSTSMFFSIFYRHLWLKKEMKLKR